MGATLFVVVGQTVISGELVSSGLNTHIQMADSRSHLWLHQAHIKNTKSSLMIVDPVLSILYLWRNVIFGQLVVELPLVFNWPSRHMQIGCKKKEK